MTRFRALEERIFDSYALRMADLAVFRIVYATFVVATIVPVASWLPRAPIAFFYPPIGLAALFEAPPPAEVLIGFNLVLTLFAAMLLFGWKTRLASLGTGLSLFVLNSWAYSPGKINHDILLVVTPLVLSFSDWGRSISIDGLRRPVDPRAEVVAWPLVLLALLTGFAMFTAGVAKATTGWLDPDLRCTYGHLMHNYLYTGRETAFAHWAVRLDSAWLWKIADWSAVAFELAFLVAVINRRLFVLISCAGVFFHFGVMILFGISFEENVLVYGAFIRMSELPFVRVPNDGQVSRKKAWISFGAAVTLGTLAALFGRSVPDAIGVRADDAIVWLGAFVGVGKLVQIVRNRTHLIRPGQARS